MTKQEAIRLLRTEQPGDNECMELAKQMGARALECSNLHFVLPVCEECGYFITGIAIRYEPELQHRNVICTTNFDPPYCPKCKTLFTRADIDCEEQTCILRGVKKEGGNDAT